MANLEVEIANREIEQALSGSLTFLLNPTPLYKAWANYLESVSVKAFRTQTAPFGSKWQSLKPATVARKRAKRAKFTRAILRETGTLFNTVNAVVLPDGASVGTNQRVGQYSLGAIHHFGAPKRNIPSRPILPMDIQGDVLPQVVTEIAQITLDYVAAQ